MAQDDAAIISLDQRVPSLGASTLLDRLSHRRSDDAFVAALRADRAARFLALVGGRPVVRSTPERDVTRLAWFDAADVARLGLDASATLFLGAARDTGAGHFALALPEGDMRRTAGAAAALAPAVDLRTLATQGVMPAEEVALAGQARSLALWHETARCCGRCGGATEVRAAGWKRVCWACGQETFPRIDPVVIMLVTDGARCVLAHEPRYPERMYSALAGYVEPGEDVAHAVRRETREEVGLDIGEVSFAASQPWPFPFSLMLGCIAHAAPADLHLADGEIADARWFTRDEARDMLARTHAGGLWLPGPQAIAHTLVAAFCADV